jgi:hypothetical protein
MARGRRLGAEQIVTKLRQIEVLQAPSDAGRPSRRLGRGIG